MQAYTVNTWLPAPTGKPPEANEVQRRLWTAVQRRDLPGQATYDQYALAGQYDGAVYIALQAISSAMSGATMQVLKRKEGSKSLAYNANDANANKDWIPAGDECGACRLLAYINPQQTPINFLVEYITCLLLFGRVFVYAVPSRSGKPCELWVIRPQYVMPLYAVSPEYPFGAWRVTIPMPFMYGFAQSGTVIIDARDMVEERMFNPQFPWDGYSPLTAGAQQIDTLRSVNESRKNTLDRGPSVDAVVTIDGASETELSRIKAEYENKYTGSRGSRVMFSSGESAKAAALGIAPKEMDFSSGYDQLTNFVLGLLGVPHPVAQLTDSSSYAQLYASIQQFRELKLKPLANSIAAHWTKHLIQKHWGHEYAMTFEMPRLMDPQSEAAAIQALGGMGVYTVNEIRGKRNEEPIEGGDIPPSVYVQTLTAKQQAAMQPPQPGMEGMPASGAEDVEQPGGELGDMLMSGVMDSLGGDGERVAKAIGWTAIQTRGGKTAAKNTATGVIVYGKRSAELLKDAGPKEYPQVNLKPEGKKLSQDDADAIDLGGDYGTMGDVMRAKTSDSQNAPLPVAERLGNNGMRIAKVAKLKIAKVAPQMAKRVEAHARTPQGQQQAATIKEWAPALAQKHAATVAQRTGLGEREATSLIVELLQHLVSALPSIGKVSAKGEVLPTAKPIPVAKKLPLANRISGVLSPPKNKAGKGSLPPRAMLKKSLRYIDRILEAEVRS